MPTLDLTSALLVSWGIVAFLMALLWLLAVRTRDAGVVDVGWAGGLALLALFHAAVAPGDPTRRILVAVLGGIWGLRLAVHLVLRGQGAGEDPRYVRLRERWGASADAWFLPFFQAQALLGAVLAVSFAVAARHPGGDSAWAPVLAVAIWLVAVGGEWLADHQLARFRRDPSNAGRTCRSGLWRWSRHPNYFFEWVHWLAYVPLAFGSKAAWWPALIAPALMYVFVTRWTGIPPTEAHALRSRGDDYRDYQRTTNAFFPGPPRASRTPRGMEAAR